VRWRSVSTKDHSPSTRSWSSSGVSRVEVHQKGAADPDARQVDILEAGAGQVGVFEAGPAHVPSGELSHPRSMPPMGVTSGVSGEFDGPGAGISAS